MIDIHSHILFNVDDGPKTIEESFALLEAAAKEGITNIICTSHFNHPMYDVNANKVIEQVRNLQNELENRQIPITLHIGHEVRISEKTIEQCLSNEALKLAKSNYLLLELPSNTIPQYTPHIIRGLLSRNITPIIAHPERNKSIAEKPARLERLIRGGAVVQITAGSLAGHFGRTIQQLSLHLVLANLVHTYGSDAHNVTTRPFLFNEGLNYLEKKKATDAIDILLENNFRILKNTPLIIYEPEEIQMKKWWNIFVKN